MDRQTGDGGGEKGGKVGKKVSSCLGGKKEGVYKRGAALQLSVVKGPILTMGRNERGFERRRIYGAAQTTRESGTLRGFESRGGKGGFQKKKNFFRESSEKINKVKGDVGQRALLVSLASGRAGGGKSLEREGGPSTRGLAGKSPRSEMGRVLA